MNWAALPRWALAGLVYVLFAALPALAYLWDESPSETDAARATALAVMDAAAAEEAEQP